MGHGFQYPQHSIDLGVHGADLSFKVGDAFASGLRLERFRNNTSRERTPVAAKTIIAVHGPYAIWTERNLACLSALTANSIEFLGTFLAKTVGTARASRVESSSASRTAARSAAIRFFELVHIKGCAG
jgi:hypothetical protein